MAVPERTLGERITESHEGMRAWQQERVIFEITERICELMEQQNISRKELADRLGKTKGYISQLLDGQTNMTLRTISDVYLALDRAFRPGDEPVTEQITFARKEEQITP